ncbi:unnamed protein product [Cuscuta campestris]|uniref:X8 domain-containing protein n=1 Tax=Cuscuta campestris TaxID=132261 RepID=A0A484KRR0_9ASTE|nr:unnamed protein product [Cuscuta campestris]
MYCLCKDGIAESQLQKNIDFACGSGADCGPILQNGPCFSPNSVNDHCSYAVNSYFQRQSPSGADCNFSGTTTLSPNPPASAAGSCVYQSTAGNNGTPWNTTSSTPGPIGPMGGEPDHNSAPTLCKPTLIFLILTIFFSSL